MSLSHVSATTKGGDVLRRHVRRFVALATVAMLVLGAFAGSASAKKISKKQKAAITKQLRKQIKKNPRAIRSKSFLRKAGLVVARREGHWSYYRLAPAKSTFHQKLLDCLCCCFQDVPELARDAKRLKDVVRCCS